MDTDILVPSQTVDYKDYNTIHDIKFLFILNINQSGISIPLDMKVKELKFNSDHGNYIFEK